MAFLSRDNLKAIMTDFKTKITANIATAKTEAIEAAATDAKAKADQALADAKKYVDDLAALGFDVEKVDALPEVASAKEKTIYLVPITDGVEPNLYNEYLLIDGKFELIGSTNISLAGYATESFVTTKISEAHTEMTPEEIQAFNTELWS